MEEPTHHIIGDPELAALYEALRKKEAELEELKARRRLLENLVEYLQNQANA